MFPVRMGLPSKTRFHGFQCKWGAKIEKWGDFRQRHAPCWKQFARVWKTLYDEMLKADYWLWEVGAPTSPHFFCQKWETPLPSTFSIFWEISGKVGSAPPLFSPKVGPWGGEVGGPLPRSPPPTFGEKSGDPITLNCFLEQCEFSPKVGDPT